jgi:hypothetical protein
MSEFSKEVREIVWVDTGQQMASTWTPKDLLIARAKELQTTVHTIGYVIEWNEDFVLVAQSIDDESGAVAGVMRIERSAIKTLTTQVGTI